MKAITQNLFTKVWTILLVFITFNSFALETPNTANPVYGSIPTATFKNINILYPDGITILQEGDILLSTNKPADYSLDLTTLDIDLWTDADGDLPHATTPFMQTVLSSPKLIWKYNGNELTTTELNQSFIDSGLAGKALTVEVVDLELSIMSATGQPDTNPSIPAGKLFNVTTGSVKSIVGVKFPAGTRTMNGAADYYILKEDMPTNWPNVGFPAAAGWLTGTKFNFLFILDSNDIDLAVQQVGDSLVSLAAKNATYGFTWTSSNPSVATIDNSAVVNLHGAGPVTLTGVSGSTVISYSFTINKWLVPYIGGNLASQIANNKYKNTTMTYSQALTGCTTAPGYRLTTYDDFIDANTHVWTGGSSAIGSTSTNSVTLTDGGGSSITYKNVKYIPPYKGVSNTLNFNWQSGIEGILGRMWAVASFPEPYWVIDDVPNKYHPLAENPYVTSWRNQILVGRWNGSDVRSTAAAFCIKTVSDPNKAVVEKLTMTKNSALANSIDIDTAQVTVSDNYVGYSGIQVKWELLGSTTAKFISSGSNIAYTTTDSAGKSNIDIINSKPETLQVKATVTTSLGGTTFKTANVIFVADPSLAQVKLSNGTNNTIANGSSKNTVKAVVTDNNNIPISNVIVTWNVSSSTVTPASGTTSKTDSNGETWFYFADTKSETVTITAVLPNGASSSITAKFNGNKLTAKISSLTTIKDNSPVKAKLNPNKVKIHVVDANGNNISGYPISWTFLGLTNPSATNLVMSSPKTDDNGEAIVEFTNYAQQQVKVTAKLITTSATDSVVTTFSQALLKIKYAIPLFNTSVKHDLEGAGSAYPTTGFYGAAFRLQVTNYTVGQTTYFTVSDPNVAYFSNTISTDTREITLRKKASFVITAGNDVDGYANKTFSIPKWISPQGDRKSGVPAGCTLANLSDLTSSTAINSPPADLGIGIGNLMAEYGYVNDYSYYPYAIYGFHPYMTHLTAAGTYKWVNTDLNSAKANYGSEINLFVSGVTTPLAAEKYACLY